MIKTFYKIIGLLVVSLFIFIGCQDKTVVSDTKPIKMEEKTIPQGEIKTH